MKVKVDFVMENDMKFSHIYETEDIFDLAKELSEKRLVFPFIQGYSLSKEEENDNKDA